MKKIIKTLIRRIKWRMALRRADRSNARWRAAFKRKYPREFTLLKEAVQDRIKKQASKNPLIFPCQKKMSGQPA